MLDTNRSLISTLCWEDFLTLIGCSLSIDEDKCVDVLVALANRYSKAKLKLSAGQVCALGS